MAETYNVFISWSSDRSKKVAAALHDWLPMVVQTAEPWMSEEDIEKGSRGLDDIGKALAAMGVGIICLTPENLEKPWILFEAGSLSKALGDKTRVCPYLFGDLRPENVKPPLGMFQATKAVKDDTRKLVATVNRVLGGPLGDEKLDTVFERMRPELEKRLQDVPRAAAAAAPERSEKEMVAELLELSRAEAGNFVWSRDALATLLRGVNRLVGAAGLAVEGTDLTLRQQQLMTLVAKGLSNKEIASHLNLSEFTVRNHIHRILKQVGAESRSEAGLPDYGVVSGVDRPLSIKEQMEVEQIALAESKLVLEEAERGVAERRARVMRLNRELQKEKRGQEGSDTAKKAGDERK